MLSIVPRNRRHPFDMREVVRLVVESGDDAAVDQRFAVLGVGGEWLAVLVDADACGHANVLAAHEAFAGPSGGATEVVAASRA